MAKHSGATNLSLRAFIAAVGSAEEAHGAVSAAAVAGGLGASLLLQVATQPQARSGFRANGATPVDAATELSLVQRQLIETIETATAVKLVAARSMPEASDADRSERQAAIQLALRASAEIPLEVMRLCARALDLASTVAAYGPRAVSADVQLGLALLQTGFDGARSNLEDKLSSFTDAGYVTSVIDEIARLSDKTTAAKRAAELLLQLPPA